MTAMDSSESRTDTDTSPTVLDSHTLHRLKNQLSIVYGFADLMLVEMAADDPHAIQITEIRQTAIAALKILSDTSGDHRDPTEDE